MDYYQNVILVLNLVSLDKRSIIKFLKKEVH